MRSNIVFDTNTLISAILFYNSIPNQAFLKGLKEYNLVTSDQCISELKVVLLRNKFKKYISTENIDFFLKTYIKKSKAIEIVCTIYDCRDQKDNKFLELAVSANAQIIVSGDSDLLVLNPYNNIKIFTPKQFLDFHSQ